MNQTEQAWHFYKDQSESSEDILTIEKLLVVCI